MVHDLFQNFGEVSNININPIKNEATINFKTDEDAEKAQSEMNGFEFEED